jgi:S-adenosylmethionine/arginine decarboxylase-like enzyme
MQDLDHKHILIRANVRKPPTDPEVVKDWFRRLVKAIDMKILIPPEVTNCTTPGNEGITGVCTIETSHSSIHVWESAEIPFLQFDLYSCKRFDPDIVMSFIHEFDPYDTETMIVDRNDNGENKPFEVVYHKKEQVIKIWDLMPEEFKTPYLEAKRVIGRKTPRTPLQKAACSEYNKLARKYSISGRKYKQTKKDSHLDTLGCIKMRCRKKQLDYDLDGEWYEEEVQKAKAKYPKLTVHSSEDSFWSANVDRIEPSKGYVKTNCRIIPKALNVAKWKWNKMELEELKKIINDL